MSILPDLLEPQPRARLALDRLERAAEFAFASAGTFTELDDALDRVEHPASSWDAVGFERPLFVQELLERAFPIHIDGVSYAPRQAHLLAVVTRPPLDGAIMEFRQRVLDELARRPAYRASMERAYVALRRFFTLLGPQEAADLETPERRRMEVLACARQAIDALASGFEGASSGLARLRAFGEEVRATEGWGRLVALLELDQNLASIEARLRVGADGTLRSFEIVAVRENQGNVFYASPFTRLWSKIKRLLRGYVFREEEARDALVDAVFAGVRSELTKLVQLRGDLEVYLAALGFRDVAMGKGLAVCLPTVAETPAPGQHIARRVEGLFNPHLLQGERAPVPCSLSFDRHDCIAIFTGPNSGGKTRMLQAVALTQMLGQAGLYVPAASAALVRAEGLFVSLIEETHADQKEGRLGTELMRIRDVFERLRPGGAVLLDELCSGTNPSEGQEIFELVTSLLVQLQPQAFITTHFLDFASRLAASSTDGSLAFLQVGLDAQEEPTYQFVPGVARSSLANKTAARLGVTRASLLELVERARQSR